MGASASPGSLPGRSRPAAANLINIVLRGFQHLLWIQQTAHQEVSLLVHSLPEYRHVVPIGRGIFQQAKMLRFERGAAGNQFGNQHG